MNIANDKTATEDRFRGTPLLRSFLPIYIQARAFVFQHDYRSINAFRLLLLLAASAHLHDGTPEAQLYVYL